MTEFVSNYQLDTNDKKRFMTRRSMVMHMRRMILFGYTIQLYLEESLRNCITRGQVLIESSKNYLSVTLGSNMRMGRNPHGYTFQQA